MKRPTQPDQIRAGEEEVEMFFRVGAKLVLNRCSFGVRSVDFSKMIIYGFQSSVIKHEILTI